jgi:hypothetical protein
MSSIRRITLAANYAAMGPALPRHMDDWHAFEVRPTVEVSWHLQILWLECCDGMYETFDHPACFTDKARAEQFLAHVKANAREINLSNWIIPDSPCCPLKPSKNVEPYIVQ